MPPDMKLFSRALYYSRTYSFYKSIAWNILSDLSYELSKSSKQWSAPAKPEPRTTQKTQDDANHHGFNETADDGGTTSCRSDHVRHNRQNKRCPLDILISGLNTVLQQMGGAVYDRDFNSKVSKISIDARAYHSNLQNLRYRCAVVMLQETAAV
jgi:hypothetical protein